MEKKRRLRVWNVYYDVHTDEGIIKCVALDQAQQECDILEAELRTLREDRDLIDRADAQFRAGSAGYITWSHSEQNYAIHAGLGEMCPHTTHKTLREALKAINAAKEPDAA